MENSTGFAQAAGRQVLPVDALADLVSSLESLEQVQSRLHAVREGLLVMASQLADAMENDGGGPGSGWRVPARELAQRSVAAEIAAATRMSDRTVQRQISQAVELAARFPATYQALSDGRISLAHARVIQEAGIALMDDDGRGRYEAAVVGCAEQQAPGRVRRLAVREAEKAQAEPLAARHERAVAGRCVRVIPLPDGMAELAATLPAAVAYGIHDRLTQMAKTHIELAAVEHAASGRISESGATAEPGTGAGENRCMDQLRADLLADLLLCGAPTGHDTPDGLLAAITARVDVTVPVLTLINEAGPDHGEPTSKTSGQTSGYGASAAGNRARENAVGNDWIAAELDGRHPIDPATARILAGRAVAWNRVLTDPIIGAVLAVDRYRPGEDLKRLLTARDSRCRFPGCGVPARDLDLDHTHDAALGGATETGNLAGLCRRHHVLKHHSRWTTRQTGNGNLEWNSPTGRSYTDRPPTPPATTAWTGKPPDSCPPGEWSPMGSKPPPF
ncbi:HNH endonuclease signature motif containing protein [Arthrobacter cupressi]|uniref:5-methylcytosine-specific restriction endonuclease McrA n=1 Tax=Arthrobacter cupressi TaxID=1045773 RepID=A0A1G8V7K5_9MICC|nr:HNH endonuclease signature motif containing protein [Arthrobacter cupressi]NYD78666.1 hypothetical protein [Arthrobacter cupressi]SDJ61993.1 5-methylcytosine-specific restriction endonuclease McrA [Arthrobacter cupressi]